MNELNPYQPPRSRSSSPVVERATWVNYVRAIFCSGFVFVVGFILTIWIAVGIEASHTVPWQRTATLLAVGIATGLMIMSPALWALWRDLACIWASRQAKP